MLVRYAGHIHLSAGMAKLHYELAVELMDRLSDLSP